jgi:hypothetical protein
VSARSELLFSARRTISNPFLLCTLVSQGAPQLMISGSGSRSTAGIVNYVLSELVDGILEFDMHGGKAAKSEPPLSHGHPDAASREVVAVERT